ncbi:hypothetical protein DPMN_108910 [Dreissena polymorpha]|uniref:Uncharacterized protein n=1 Tax=Dreissena polymorpha TaxID=45954 RepID=A0A9D4KA06_DREPO|nr:hypothetical protein DPMN_108910 [Dreissena polymorpha]
MYIKLRRQERNLLKVITRMFHKATAKVQLETQLKTDRLRRVQHSHLPKTIPPPIARLAGKIR